MKLTKLKNPLNQAHSRSPSSSGVCPSSIRWDNKLNWLLHCSVQLNDHWIIYIFFSILHCCLVKLTLLRGRTNTGTTTEGKNTADDPALKRHWVLILLLFTSDLVQSMNLNYFIDDFCCFSVEKVFWSEVLLFVLYDMNKNNILF